MKKTYKHSLKDLLSLITEESVFRAREELFRTSEEEAQLQKIVQKSLGKLSHADTKDEHLEEQGDEEPEAPQQEKPAPKPAPKKVEKPVPAPAKEPQTQTDDEPLQVSFAMIKDKLNTIRAGRSLRDREIRHQLKSYFKNLDEEEQEALFTYLDSISKILIAGIDGDEVAEPNDPPHNIEMVKSNQDDGDDDDDENEVRITQPSQSTPKQVSSNEDEDEDTSPPIEVGRKQRTESLRRKVKELFG